MIFWSLKRLSYKGFLVFEAWMAIYFRNYTENVCAVCQRKAGFVFNFTRRVFAQETLVWFTKGVQSLNSQRMHCPAVQELHWISPCLFFLKQVLLIGIWLQKRSLLLQCLLGFPSQSEGKGSSSTAWDGSTPMSFGDFHKHYQGSSKSTQDS